MKGLSGIIAAVLLIAFVVALAIVLSNFLFDFTRTQTGDISEEGKRTVPCTIAAVEIDETAIYNVGGTLRVAVQNNGRTDLKDIDLLYIVTGSGVVTTSQLNATINSGEIKTINATDVNNAVERIIVTTECPGVTDTVNNKSGTFKHTD